MVHIAGISKRGSWEMAAYSESCMDRGIEVSIINH